MHSDSSVLMTLDDLVSAELTARDQWFLYARIVENWGLHKLSEKLMEESSEEAGHARALIDRMVFLEKSPSMTVNAINSDETLARMFDRSMGLELKAVADYRSAIQLCASKDPTTRTICERHLGMEEGHVNWLEEQLFLLEKLGEGVYMQMQT